MSLGVAKTCGGSGSSLAGLGAGFGLLGAAAEGKQVALALDIRMKPIIETRMFHFTKKVMSRS
jgi:hypothetical protein